MHPSAVLYLSNILWIPLASIWALCLIVRLPLQWKTLPLIGLKVVHNHHRLIQCWQWWQWILQSLHPFSHTQLSLLLYICHWDSFTWRCHGGQQWPPQHYGKRAQFTMPIPQWYPQSVDNTYQCCWAIWSPSRSVTSHGSVVDAWSSRENYPRADKCIQCIFYYHHYPLTSPYSSIWPSTFIQASNITDAFTSL